VVGVEPDLGWHALLCIAAGPGGGAALWRKLAAAAVGSLRRGWMLWRVCNGSDTTWRAICSGPVMLDRRGPMSGPTGVGQQTSALESPIPKPDLQLPSPINLRRDRPSRILAFVFVDATLRISAFILGYALLISGSPFRALGVLLSAVSAVSLIASTFHECVHHNLPLPRRIQNLVGVGLASPLGLSYSWWRIKHVRLHHPYVGDATLDPDIQFAPLGRVKREQPWRPAYRLQPLWMLIGLPFSLLNMLSPRDIWRARQAADGTSAVYLCIEKYGGFIICWTPLALTVGLLNAAAIVVAVLLAGGTFGGVVAQLQHNTERSNYYSTDDLGRSKERQFFLTTDTKSATGTWWWISGGASRHVAHHLYPRFTYVEIPRLTRQLRRTLGVPWPEHRGPISGIRSAANLIISLRRAA
jgi:linoleoyl-CoA desaturase